MNEIFPIRHSDYVIEFGKYKGKTIKEIYSQDTKYIFWLMEKDHYFRVDFDQLLNIPENTSDRERIIEDEISRVFPKATPNDVISFGKYKGKTFREIFATDPSYIDWFLRNNQTLDIDVNAFVSMMRSKGADSKG